MVLDKVCAGLSSRFVAFLCSFGAGTGYAAAYGSADNTDSEVDNNE